MPHFPSVRHAREVCVRLCQSLWAWKCFKLVESQFDLFWHELIACEIYVKVMVWLDLNFIRQVADFFHSKINLSCKLLCFLLVHFTTWINFGCFFILYWLMKTKIGKEHDIISWYILIRYSCGFMTTFSIWMYVKDSVMHCTLLFINSTYFTSKCLFLFVSMGCCSNYMSIYTPHVQICFYLFHQGRSYTKI